MNANSKFITISKRRCDYDDDDDDDDGCRHQALAAFLHCLLGLCQEHVGKDTVCAFAWGRDGRLASPEQLTEVARLASWKAVHPCPPIGP